MSFNPAQALAEQVAHCVQLAMTPGWWAYTQQKVIAMEADKHAQGLWHGLRAKVAAQLKACGFKPAPDELGEWWLTPNKGELT